MGAERPNSRERERENWELMTLETREKAKLMFLSLLRTPPIKYHS
jgi:hypothetical protein